MSNHRPDLGPQLRRVLAEQLAPPIHNIPVHSELGAQIRRGFMLPAPGRVFCSFDYEGMEMRLAALYAGPAGGGYGGGSAGPKVKRCR